MISPGRAPARASFLPQMPFRSVLRDTLRRAAGPPGSKPEEKRVTYEYDWATSEDQLRSGRARKDACAALEKLLETHGEGWHALGRTTEMDDLGLVVLEGGHVGEARLVADKPHRRVLAVSCQKDPGRKHASFHFEYDWASEYDAEEEEGMSYDEIYDALNKVLPEPWRCDDAPGTVEIIGDVPEGQEAHVGTAKLVKMPRSLTVGYKKKIKVAL